MRVVVCSEHGGDSVSETKQSRRNTTSCAVRNRWNAKHYDRINITIPKGYGDMFRDYCEENNTTMNAVLTAIIKFELANAKKEAE